MSQYLHDAIMNLPLTPGMLHESMHRAYKFGHKDARHAAAELAIAAQEQEPSIKDAEITDAEILAIAHRKATTYAHCSDPKYHC